MATSHGLGSACLSLLCLISSRLPAQAPPATRAPRVVRLTVDEAKQRALSTSKLLAMAGLNTESKAYAIRAMRAMYFPQVSGTAVYLHFQDPLGTVLTKGGRTVSGPRGMPL